MYFFDRIPSRALKQAGADFLQSLLNVDSLEDRSPMEHRHAVSTMYELSVSGVAIYVHAALTKSTEAASTLGDAAKVIYGKLCERDSGISVSIAQKMCARVSEDLTDVVGSANQFRFQLVALSHTEQASSAHNLELAVSGSLPELCLASQRSIGESVRLGGEKGN